jgi:hypothetical protein
MKEGIDENRDRYQTILNFHDRFLETLSTIMYKAGARMEYDGEGNQQEKTCQQCVHDTFAKK